VARCCDFTPHRGAANPIGFPAWWSPRIDCRIPPERSLIERVVGQKEIHERDGEADERNGFCIHLVASCSNAIERKG
jgi:hypothetical protein